MIDTLIESLQLALASATALAGQQQAPLRFPQYLLDDSGVHGPTRLEWSQELRARWASASFNGAWRFANWLDATGMSQGLVPYRTLSIGPTTPLGYVSADVTVLARKWLETGHNRGIYLRSEASTTFTAFARIDGRYTLDSEGKLVISPNAPKLVVVTDRGTFELVGVAAGYISSSALGLNTQQTLKLAKGTVGFLHFPDLETVRGVITSATLKLWLTARHTTSVLTLQLMETDPPYMHVGGDGGVVEPGIAMEVGEENLPGHPDVFEAGDFRESNLVTMLDSNGAKISNRTNPSPLFTFNRIPCDIIGYEHEFLDDPDAPGTTQMRASFVHGDGRTYSTSGPSFRGEFTKAVLTDPKRPIDTSQQILEMYHRCYIELEEDFWTTTDGIKGGIGFDCRFGYWQDGQGGYWQHTSGNSGAKGTGLKIESLRKPGQFEYQGHSIRMHFDLCKPNGPYQAFRPILMMVSHNGTFEWTTPYGTEEIVRCGTVVMQKARKHCVELGLRMNSIVGPFDALGNGVGVRDGWLGLWVDGVKRWEGFFIWRRHPDIGICGPWNVWVHGGLTPCAPGGIMHFLQNHYACARRYIGPHPGRM